MERHVSIDLSSLEEQGVSSSSSLPVQIHLTGGNNDALNVEQPRRNRAELNDDTNEEHDGGESPWSNLRQLLMRHPELRVLLSSLERYAPFILLLATKLVFDHAGGIVVLVCLLCTFYHGNSVLKQQVGRQARRMMLPLFAVTVNLAACVLFVYIVFGGDGDLYHSAILLPPAHVSSLYELVWLTGVNDFLLKFVAIVTKIGIVALPPSLIAYAHRGKYFLFLERSYQLHRQLAPIPVWLQYLLNYSEIPGKAFGVLLVAAYMVAKGRIIMINAKHWKEALHKLMQNLTYGTPPTVEQVKAAGGTCPICYDAFQHPTLLACHHIFCEECLALWFDRERSCPLCRAVVAHDPEWRDGATSMFIQIF